MSGPVHTPAVDWSVFDAYPESTCTCRCGTTFRSHAKVVTAQDTLRTLTRKPCPNCERDDNCGRIESDPEQMQYGGPR